MTDESRTDVGDGGSGGQSGDGGGSQQQSPPAPPARVNLHDGDLTGLPPDELQRMIRELRQENGTTRNRVKSLEDAAEKTRRENESAVERQVREAAEAARTETAAEYELRLAEADVLAAAAGRLHDPHDAIGHMPIADIAAEKDGRKRAKMIDDRLEALTAEKPYLLASSSGDGRQQLVTQGVRSGTARTAEDPDAWLRRARKR